MTEHAKRAEELFFSGCNCAQAVFCAFEDVTGFEHQLAMRMSSSFGGGFGRMREVCGTMSGASMVAGILWGYAETDDDKVKAAHYTLIQDIANRFKSKHGTILCRDLLKGIANDTNPVPEARTNEYYKKRPCVRFVVTMAEVLDEILAEKGMDR